MGQDNFDDKSKYEGYNSLESKTEPEQRRTQLSRPSFVIRLVVSSLLLIWFSFSAISHLSKSTLSQRPSKGNFKNPSEHGDVNFEDVSITNFLPSSELILLRSPPARSSNGIHASMASSALVLPCQWTIIVH